MFIFSGTINSARADIQDSDDSSSTDHDSVRLSPSELLDLYLFGKQSSDFDSRREDRQEERDRERRDDEDEKRREKKLRRKWLEDFRHDRFDESEFKSGFGDFDADDSRATRSASDDRRADDRREDDLGADDRRADDARTDDIRADEAGMSASSSREHDDHDFGADSERRKRDKEVWKSLTTPIRGMLHDWVPDRVNRLHNGAFEKEPDNGFPVPYRLNGHLDIQRKLPWEEEID